MKATSQYAQSLAELKARPAHYLKEVGAMVKITNVLTTTQ